MLLFTALLGLLPLGLLPLILQFLLLERQVLEQIEHQLPHLVQRVLANVAGETKDALEYRFVELSLQMLILREVFRNHFQQNL